MQIKWIEETKHGWIADTLTVDEKHIFTFMAGAYGYVAAYYDKTLTDFTVMLPYEEIKRIARIKYGKEDFETQRIVVREYFLNDYKTRVLNRTLDDIEWVDYQREKGCVSVCRKNGTAIFEILKNDTGYTVNFLNFKRKHLLQIEVCTDYWASVLATEKFGEDNEGNRLLAVKEFFVEKYREQLQELKEDIERMEI